MPCSIRSGHIHIRSLQKSTNVPFYVAAPVSTFDFERFEDEIEIELRKPEELKYFGTHQIAPLGVNVYNPAFDATPMENVTAHYHRKWGFLSAIPP